METTRFSVKETDGDFQVMKINRNHNIKEIRFNPKSLEIIITYTVKKKKK